MKIPIILLTLINLIIFSCNNKELNDFKNKSNIFNKINIPKAELKGNEIKLDTEILNVDAIFLFDSLIIIRSNQNKNCQLKIYNLNNYNYIGCYGKIGKGPGEFLGLYTIDKLSDSDYLWALDITKGVLTEIHLDSSLKFMNKYIPSTELVIRRPRIYNFRQLDQNLFLGITYGYEPRIRLFNRSLQEISSSLNFPYLDNRYGINEGDFTRKVKSNIFQYKLCLNKDKNLLAFLYTNHDLIQIVNYKNNSIKNLIGPENTYPPDYNINSRGIGVITSDSKKAYRAAFGTSKHFYGLYSGSKFRDPDRNRGDEIYQFNWNGTVIKKYILDQKISNFIVDESEDKIIGVNMLNKNPLIEFNIE